MRETIEAIRYQLDTWGSLAEIILNALSLIVILAGVALSLIKGIQERQKDRGQHPLHSNFRMIFGGWLVVALELQLGADIAGTIVAPSTRHLIELGAIALIRTFLNYFLGKELEQQRERSFKKQDDD